MGIFDRLTKGFYMGFTVDHDQADAVQRFIAKYGVAPEVVAVSLGNMLIGPIPEKEERREAKKR
jgi:hypothetical protein